MALDFPASPTTGDQVTLNGVVYEYDGNKWVTLRALFSRGEFTAGTAADPGFSINGDPNTGFYSPGADQIGITTNGTAALTVNASQQVGIGTVSPATSVHVRDSNAVLTLQADDDSICQVKFGDATDVSRGNISYDNADESIQFKNNNNQEAMRIDSSGRLLVGTDSNYGLTTDVAVAGDNEQGIVSIIRDGDTFINTNETLGTIAFGGHESGGTGYIGASIQSQAGGAWDAAGADGTSGRLLFKTTAVGDTTATTRMRINTDGNIQIGSTSDVGARLSIFGSDDTAYSSTNVPYASTCNLLINNDDQTLVGSYAGLAFRCYGDNSNATRGSIGLIKTSSSGSNGAMVFGMRGSSYGDIQERMRITSDGRLAIGTTSASSKVEISSSADAHSDLNVASNYHLRLQNPENDSGEAVGLCFGLSSGGDIGASIYHYRDGANSYGSLRFATKASGGSVTERMRIHRDGAVAVGDHLALITSTTPFQVSKASGSQISYFNSESIGNGQSSSVYARAEVSGTSRLAALQVRKHSTITNAVGVLFLDRENGGNSYFWADNSANLRTSGNNGHVGTTSGTVVGTQTSDERLKNVGVAVTYGLAEVKQLQPKQYALKTEPDINKLGFIAQEVESIIPEAVFDTKEELEGHEDGDRTKLGMEYVQLIPVLVNAIKELSAENADLTARITALEAN